MNETCDRCGPAVRAAYRTSRGGQLYLCGHCANPLWPALSAQGWAIGLIATPAVTLNCRPERMRLFARTREDSGYSS